MYKLEMETYGGKITVESGFLNFINDIGELIKRKELAEVHGITDEAVIQREACFVKRAENCPICEGKPQFNAVKESLYGKP